jgi:hypothetical protein
VVSKSYPDFWIDLAKIGITINKSWFTWLCLSPDCILAPS